MSSYLITGRSGSGKSTVYRELVSRGYTAHDGDTAADLSGWRDLATNKRIEEDYPGDDHVGKFRWEWDESVLQKLLGRSGVTFICGNAENATDFYGLFDKVFVLSVDEAEQRRRIMIRPEHDYGKDPAIQNEVIKQQQLLVQAAHDLGAIVIDATPTAPAVVDDILAWINHDD